MASYTVLANRYRPHGFAEVVGQTDVARVLQASLASGRAAHAFLFSGPRGVGKTSMARILAKALNCLENEVGEPCNACRVCRAIDGHGDALDVVEIDGASHNRVENVRELIENLRFRPVEARYRITIVDEVHMLSTAAFNALLKTLEEPPEHAKFILATTEPLKVPETIRSRCQMYDFARIPTVTIAERLDTILASEGVQAEDGVTRAVARHAQGGMRDALSLLDQLVTGAGEGGSPSLDDVRRLTGRFSPAVLSELLGACLAGDVPRVSASTRELLARGARPADLVGQVSEVLEGLLVLVTGGTPADRADDELAALQQLAGVADLDRVLAMLDVLVEAGQRLRQRHDGGLVIEMAMLSLARLAQLTPLADLLAGGGAPAPAQPAAPRSSQPAAPPAQAPATGDAWSSDGRGRDRSPRGGGAGGGRARGPRAQADDPGPPAASAATDGAQSAPVGASPPGPAETPQSRATSATPDRPAVVTSAPDPNPASPAPSHASKPAAAPAPSPAPKPAAARKPTAAPAPKAAPAATPPSPPAQAPAQPTPADAGPSAAAPERAPEATDPREALLAAIPSRSLRVELARCPVLKLAGGRLEMVPPSGSIHDWSAPAVQHELLAAARQVAGRDVELVLGAAASPAPGSSGPGIDVDSEVRRLWPGAERVDF